MWHTQTFADEAFHHRQCTSCEQETLYIEHFQKEGAPQSGSLRDRWLFTAYESDRIIHLNSLGIQIVIADVYHKIILENN